MKFNEKLIALRKEKGLSQEGLGEKLDVARQTVSKWELGETTPEMDKLIKISEIFEISLDDLMKDTNVKQKQEINNTNTQKLAGMLITIIKVIGVIIIIGIILSIIGLISFTVDTKIITQENRTFSSYGEIEVQEDIYMEVNQQSVTKTGLELTIYNKTNEELGYGEDYFIEKQENGNWKAFPGKPDAIFAGIGILLKPNSSHQEKISFQEIYGELPTGKYRIIKEISEYIISAEFEVK